MMTKLHFSPVHLAHNIISAFTAFFRGSCALQIALIIVIIIITITTLLALLQA